MTPSNRRLLIILSLAVIGMFGFGFALVPLYSVMCKALGINGKFDGKVSAQAAVIDQSRLVTVEFVATNNANLPWAFYPMTSKINVHPGQNVVINYFAKNISSHTMTVQAIPSVSPGLAAKYLKKTECFCFTQQTFKAGEQRKMPVLFHLDPDLPKNIHTVTLSYTMFDTAKLANPSNNKTPGRIQQ